MNATPTADIASPARSHADLQLIRAALRRFQRQLMEWADLETDPKARLELVRDGVRCVEIANDLTLDAVVHLPASAVQS